TLVGSVLGLARDEGRSPRVDGGFRYFAFTEDNDRAIRGEGPLRSIPDGLGNELFGGDRVELFVLNGADYDEDRFAAPMTATQGGDDPGSYNALHPVRRLATPGDFPGTRSARTLAGYAAGVADRGAERVALAGGTGTPSDVRIDTDPTVAGITIAIDLAAYSSGPPTDYRISFGGGDRGVFVDDGRWVALEASEPGAARGVAFTHAMVAGGEGGEWTLPGGVEPCTCAYLDWGWWATSDQVADPDLATPLGSFVAGDLPELNEIPLEGGYTYTGHAVAHVVNDGARYVAAGTFENRFDFLERQGTVTIAGLDGRTFTGVVESTEANGRDYATPDDLLAGDRSMQLQGSFFRAAADPVGATGGQFQVAGPDYTGVGTFAASGVPD
ncbi:MAG: hypothetical protein ACOCYE_12660, partial [Pseudomonadota bacterium]